MHRAKEVNLAIYRSAEKYTWNTPKLQKPNASKKNQLLLARDFSRGLVFLI